MPEISGIKVEKKMIFRDWLAAVSSCHAAIAGNPFGKVTETVYFSDGSPPISITLGGNIIECLVGGEKESILNLRHF
mgnify:CR=1 FL=1